MNITGHHHISIYTKNAKQNKAFYTSVLGLRLVAKTVNQENPEMYHLFYGDDTGTAGTLLTFFEIPNIGRNQPGTDSVASISLLVPDDDALAFFKDRLEDDGIVVKHETYLNQKAVMFKDPDGVCIRLISNNDYTVPDVWRRTSNYGIPEAYQILGLGPVELKVTDRTSTLNFLKHSLNYHIREDTGMVILTRDESGLYSDIIVSETPGIKAKPGRGYVHHIALNTPTEADLTDIFERIAQKQGKNTGIIDRSFFKSLYYRQNHIMYEFATEGPGFTVDSSSKRPGEQLILPDFLEYRRQEIEADLEHL